MHKYLTKAFVFFFMLFCLGTTAQKTEWLQDFGGNALDLQASPSKSGKIYVLANYDHDFQISGQTIKVHPLGTYRNDFIASLDGSTGKVLWIKTFAEYGSTGSNITFVQGDSGEFYLNGITSADSIQIGTYTMKSPILKSWVFMAKLDSSGNCVWVRQCKQGVDGIKNNIDLQYNGTLGFFALINEMTHFDLEGVGFDDPNGRNAVYLVRISLDGRVTSTQKIATGCELLFIEGDMPFYRIGKSFVVGRFYKQMALGNTPYSSPAFDNEFYTSLDSDGTFSPICNAATNGQSLSGDFVVSRKTREVYLCSSFNTDISFGDLNLGHGNPQYNGQILAKCDTDRRIEWEELINIPPITSQPDLIVDDLGFSYLWNGSYYIDQSLDAVNLQIFDKNGNMVRKLNMPMCFVGADIDESNKMLLIGDGIGNSSLFGTTYNTPINHSYIAKIDFALTIDDTFKAPGSISLNNFLVYPNPVSDGGQLHIKSDMGFYSGDLTNTLFDAMGRRIFTYTQQSAGTEYDIPVNHLEAGMYFLRIANGGETKNFKVMVQN